MFLRETKKMQLSLFDTLPEETKPEIELSELFEAYYDCRKTKRNTFNALAFEVDYESNLVSLYHEINSGSYKPGKSIAFIVNNPVTREIFAADFRDRVVHHLVINKLNPLFEDHFIYDSYACRPGKGTRMGIQRVNKFIKQCSHNYTRDCYILKLDIEGFFMHINKNVLFGRLYEFTREHYQNRDQELLIELCRKTIYNNCTGNCIIKGKKGNWKALPASKSLFHSPEHCGLPIGNLTSQIFANFYLNTFDHFIKHELGIRFYGRYVDDFVLIHPEKEYLKSLIPVLRNFLQSELQLSLHPKKIYLQHYSKGVKFLGAYIKPNRIYIGNRTKGNFYDAIERQNIIARDHKPTKSEKGQFLSSMNSYLGIMKHYRTYRLRKKILFKHLSVWWWNHVYLKGGIAKFSTKR